MSNLNQQNQNISGGTLVKEIPYGQTNISSIDPTPGILCFGTFLLILIILYKKCEEHYLNYFEHKKEMDILELDLKYGRKNIL